MILEGLLFGKMRQQFGKSVVFTVWKGKQVAKQYAHPSNPKTDSQMTVRNKFTSVLIIALAYTTAIISIYWRKYAVGMSAFNAFMKYNLLASSYPINPALLLFAKGGLTPTPLSSATYSDVDGVCSFAWNPALSGNQASSDHMVMVVFNEDNSSVYTIPTPVVRSVDHASFTIPVGLDFGKLHAYLFGYRYLGQTNETISNNSYLQMSEP